MKRPARPLRGNRPAAAAAGALLAWLLAAPGLVVADEGAPVVTLTDPRAFGWQVGDVVPRHISVRVPGGLRLDESSLPQAGNRGKAIELQRVDWHRAADGSGARYDIDLAYQVFLAPRDVRTLELPMFRLRFEGAPRAEEVRVEAWPVTVAPLVPADVSPRRGLGEMQPDAAPGPIDTSATRRRLLLWGVLAAGLAAYAALVWGGAGWWARRQRPFTTAWRALRSLPASPAPEQRRDALRSLHDALNRTAGRVLFERDVDAFIAARPRFESLRADLRRFFGQSQREFFAVDGVATAAADAAHDGAGFDARWLRDFCRRCRDAERGSA